MKHTHDAQRVVLFACVSHPPRSFFGPAYTLQPSTLCRGPLTGLLLSLLSPYTVPGKIVGVGATWAATESQQAGQGQVSSGEK